MRRFVQSPNGTRPGRMRTSRRAVLKTIAAAGAAVIAAPAVLGQTSASIVVVGGGFAGATCARSLKRRAGNVAVTLIEPNPRFTACPFSNAVIAGLRDLDAQQFGYDGVKQAGIEIVTHSVAAVEPEARRVRLD